jgi:hypothetical protein
MSTPSLEAWARAARLRGRGWYLRLAARFGADAGLSWLNVAARLGARNSKFSVIASRRLEAGWMADHRPPEQGEAAICWGYRAFEHCGDGRQEPQLSYRLHRQTGGRERLYYTVSRYTGGANKRVRILDATLRTMRWRTSLYGSLKQQFAMVASPVRREKAALSSG